MKIKSVQRRFTVKIDATPRNPLVAQALFRKAGTHEKPNKSLRQQAKREIQKGIFF